MYNKIKLGVKLQDDILTNPAKILEGIPAPTEGKPIDSFTFHWVVSGGLRKILDLGKRGRNPLYLLNVKPNDVVKITVEVVRRN